MAFCPIATLLALGIEDALKVPVGTYFPHGFLRNHDGVVGNSVSTAS